jgi:hypothetical protein
VLLASKCLHVLSARTAPNTHEYERFFDSKRAFRVVSVHTFVYSKWAIRHVERGACTQKGRVVRDLNPHAIRLEVVLARFFERGCLHSTRVTDCILSVQEPHCSGDVVGMQWWWGCSGDAAVGSVDAVVVQVNAGSRGGLV